VEPVSQASPFAGPSYELRNPYGRRYGGASRARDANTASTSRTYAYENEDQSKTQMKVGIRVRHKQFGVGSVIAIEDHGDDYKVTVRFASVGTKRLLASFAGLEPA
jgi:DNA helicase-2/ATP-dependent DNA helicase PcrA